MNRRTVGGVLAGLAALMLVMWGTPVRAQPKVVQDIPMPPGLYDRVEEEGWVRFLRNMPLMPRGSKVLYRDGRPKRYQDGHVAVVNLDVMRFQQCSDSILRLRAEWLWGGGVRDSRRITREIGMGVVRWRGRTRKQFDRYLNRVFVRTGTLNMDRGLHRSRHQPRVGDALVWGGSPGHAVLIVDVVQDPQGGWRLMMGQGWTPAQQFHIMRHLHGSEPSAWWSD